jgi:hypothetical protein
MSTPYRRTTRKPSTYGHDDGEVYVIVARSLTTRAAARGAGRTDRWHLRLLEGR